MSQKMMTHVLERKIKTVRKENRSKYQDLLDRMLKDELTASEWNELEVLKYNYHNYFFNKHKSTKPKNPLVEYRR